MPENTNWLPSPGKSTLIGIVALLIVIGALLSTREKKDEVLLAVNENGEIELPGEDTDGDGLRDWEEDLWGTDPENVDSDGDGTHDGAEVDVGRNPSIPAPNDTFAIPSKTAFTQTVSQDNKTQVETFSEAFITTYLNSKLVGGDPSSQAEEFAELAIPQLPPVIEHTTGELSVTQNTDEEIIHEYGNTVGSILKNNAPQIENELIIILRALRDSNPALLADLEKTTSSYNRNAENLLDIIVPNEIAQLHIQLINSFSLVSRDITYMAMFFEDPLTALAGIDSYFRTSEQLVLLINALAQYLGERTSFTPNEDGYVLTSGL